MKSAESSSKIKERSWNIPVLFTGRAARKWLNAPVAVLKVMSTALPVRQDQNLHSNGITCLPWADAPRGDVAVQDKFYPFFNLISVSLSRSLSISPGLSPGRLSISSISSMVRSFSSLFPGGIIISSPTSSLS